MITIGFEVETWRNPYNSNLLSRYFSNFHTDGSGPEEFSTPPFPLFQPKLPLYDIIVSAFMDFRRRSELAIVESCDDDWDDDCEDEVRTASIHHHIRYSWWPYHCDEVSDDKYYARIAAFFNYLREYLPLMQPFLVYRIKRKGNEILLDFSDKEKREYWAAEPDEFQYLSPCTREYLALAPNPSDAGKPFTIELRLCETAPQICQAALVYLLLGYKYNVKLSHGARYYSDFVKVRELKEYIKAVESAAYKDIPRWARIIAGSVIRGKRPVTIRGLLSQGIITKSDVVKVFKDYADDDDELRWFAFKKTIKSILNSYRLVPLTVYIPSR